MVKFEEQLKKVITDYSPQWDNIPRSWDESAFHGNGLLGASIFAYQEIRGIKPLYKLERKYNDTVLHWHIGRSDIVDVPDKEGHKWRLPIGDMALLPVGEIHATRMEQNLWNAEVYVDISTSKGAVNIRSFTHRGKNVGKFHSYLTVCAL